MTSSDSTAQMLYEESRKNHLEMKWMFAIFIIVPFFAILWGTAGEEDIVTVILLILLSIVAVFMAVRLGFARKRFRIFEDRMNLSLPWKIFPSLETLWHGEVIKKDDIQAARFEVLSRNGDLFQIEVPGGKVRGMSGEWRLELVLKNGDECRWEWRGLVELNPASRKEGREAMERFLEGIPGTVSTAQSQEGKTELARSIDKRVKLEKTLEFADVMIFYVAGFAALGIGGFFLWIAIEMFSASDHQPLLRVVFPLLFATAIMSIGVASIVGANRRLKRRRLLLGETQGDDSIR